MADKNIYLDNAKKWRKERTYNERTLALEEMQKIAGKHFPELVSIIRKEIDHERSNITRDNLLRFRASCIGRMIP